MKKLNVLFVCAIMLLSSFLFFGCNNETSEIDMYKDKGFVAIYSLKYTIQEGNYIFERNLNSKYSITLEEERTQISADEYRDLDYKIYHNELNIIPNKEIDFVVGETVKYQDSYYGYFTAKIKSIKKLYVFVKVRDNNLIEIINDNNHILVNPICFHITYFN